MKPVLVALLLIGLTAAGCSTAKPTSDHRRPAGEHVPPGHCRIVGLVLKVDSARMGSMRNDPRFRPPWDAWIEVQQVVEHGAGTNEISPHDTLKARFAFTLNPATRTDFPTLNQNLPGLSTGSVFAADIELMPRSPGTSPAERLYLVTGYSKIK